SFAKTRIESATATNFSRRRGVMASEVMCALVADDPQNRYMVRHAGNQFWRRGADLSGPPPDWAPLRPE
ncbi:MAG: hypothetical protein V3R30_15210, partial [Kiloniellales bacterium]